ncbi:MAG: noncanonical pyrimidine nucleotidase, YjjG family [Ruminococcaceae bacterium]|nr:noncanonical pyrimidine nucleotidase, YjjG family [Oscillospiraceae bacterium]
MIKNLLFDLDDTILDFKKAESVALQNTLRMMGIEPEPRILLRYSEINQEQWKLLELGQITRAELKPRRYRILFEEFGLDASAEEAAATYEQQLGIGHYFMDGAEEALQRLSQSYRIYIVSNGTAVVQHSRIASSGIEKYISGLFISQEVGFDKPSPEFFSRVFDSIADFSKEETVIIGDSLSADIKGGLAAGITAIWFNPRKTANESGVVPHYELRHLSELDELLRAIR